MQNFLAVFKLALPILGVLVPGSAAFLPLINIGVSEAAALPGASGADKRAHVLNLVAVGAAAASATGKVPIDPATAQAIAANVISVIDGIKSAHETAVAATPEGIVLPVSQSPA